MLHINSLKQLRLFSFLILLIFSACKKPGESLGESLQPEEDLLFAQQNDTTPLHAYTMKKEPVRIDLYANYLVGNYVDETFGTTRCSAVMQLTPASTSTLNLSKNEFQMIASGNMEFRIDSVVLSMAYQKESYGNNVPMYFSVNELTELLDINTDYYSDKQVNKSAINLIEPGTEIQETFPERASSVASDPKVYLRLKLRKELGRRLLLETPLSTFSAFSQKFMGLVVSSATVDGRVLSFAAVDTKLTVYYRKITDLMINSDQDVEYAFDFQNSSACESFSLIDHQYFGSPLASLTSTHELNGDEVCYAQSLNGTRVRVDLSAAAWLQEIPGVVINKAELVIPYDKDEHYAPVEGLTIKYLKNNDDSYHRINDSLYTGGAVNINMGFYRFNITQHLQDVIDGRISSTDLFITDEPVLLTGSYNSIGIRRSVLRGPFFSSDPKRNMRLIITYSK